MSPVNMKLFKVLVHNKGFYGEDLMLNPKDFPNLRKGDIVEIYHPEDDFSRLLLQITAFKDDMQGRDAISVEQSVATTFQLRTYADVVVASIDPNTVELDSVEMAFKDQYMGRSEMWRLKNSMVGTCVYLHKKLEFCSGSVRCQVYEMWTRGDRVACGVVTERTKIVFRSSTSMVYLFIQMSSEMWDFDIHGDLYFEKAVNGFLTDLFQKWKNHGSNHEVTIVLFSRTFYLAHSIDEFPTHMKECLQKDYKGRFYEDFYRVAVQNEKYEDWSPVLIELKKIFSNYQKSVLECNYDSDQAMPKAVNSTAAQGNFLEVLNMSLNVFEKNYLDRSFDRTGQLAVVITPGVGVFEVDRELTNATKQRIIDNGVGSDLVCLGEQPLHAVPLFKFHNRDSIVMGDDYSMPHWINLSFFSSDKRVAYSNFVPRIKLPPKITTSRHGATLRQVTRSKALPEEDDNAASSVIDFDAYDSVAFSIPHSQSSKSRPLKKTSVAGIESLVSRSSRRKLSDPDVHFGSEQTCLSIVGSLSKSPAIEIPLRSRNDMSCSMISSTLHSDSTCRRSGTGILGSETESPPCRFTVGSNGSGGTQFQFCNSQASPRPGKSLINPFDPSHITVKLTSNRRRWTHIFPKGPTGNLIQHHHYQRNSFQNVEPSVDLTYSDGGRKGRPSFSTLPSLTSSQSSAKRSALLWGVTGEQEWSSALTTGVDWKSLTIPACLPITTDYFPDDICLRSDYVFSDYNLLPDAVNADYARQRIVYRKPLLTLEVFHELISQRLAHGFQLIVDSGSDVHLTIAGQSGSSVVGGSRSKEGNSIEFKLSIGRIFHRISLNGSEIRVTRYRPRHPYPTFNFHYWYRLQTSDLQNYGVSWASFSTEKLENFNWNYFDHYICTRGDADFALLNSLKYWRFRLFVLPMCQSATKKILDGSSQCNVYNYPTVEEQQTLAENFLKYIETWINKIKRQQPQSKSRDLSGLNVPNLLNQRRYSTGIIFLKSNVGGNSPFRERLGSNRLPEKPRPRSGSKVFERSKASQSIDSPIPSASDTDHTEVESEGAQHFVLKAGADHQEIFEAMKNSNTGLTFITPAPSLPKYTFVSADAVQWLMNRVEGVKEEQALIILQGMLKEKLICHASGDSNRRFIHGFYLYHLKYGREELKDGETLPVGDLSGFENEWMEVELEKDPPGYGKSRFLAKELPDPTENKALTYKHSHLEMDVQNKSDRVEWGHIKYQSTYNPTKAFEIVVQWAAASGAIVADLIFGWARKAQSCGLQMIPIPAVPFTLPCSRKFDPLRSPAFIAVDTECLMENRSYLFEEFEEFSRNRRLALFLEAITIKFGFIRCPAEGSLSQLHQYVHLSGNVFLLIPSQTCVHAPETPLPLNPLSKCGASPEPSVSPHSDYVSQLAVNHVYNHDDRVGFLWYRNYMASRRWKLGPTSVASDESFQNKLLADFKAFCSNKEGRLVAFWHHAKENS